MLPPEVNTTTGLCVCPQPENSSSELSGSVLYSGPVDPSQWVGLRKTDGKLLDYLRVRQYGGGPLVGGGARSSAWCLCVVTV